MRLLIVDDTFAIKYMLVEVWLYDENIKFQNEKCFENGIEEIIMNPDRYDGIILDEGFPIKDKWIENAGDKFFLKLKEYGIRKPVLFFSSTKTQIEDSLIIAQMLSDNEKNKFDEFLKRIK